MSRIDELRTIVRGPTWQDQVSAAEELHELYQRFRTSWTIAETAAKLEMRPSQLSSMLQLAKLRSQAIFKAKTMNQAKQMLKLHKSRLLEEEIAKLESQIGDLHQKVSQS